MDQETVEFQDVLVITSGEGMVRFVYLLVVTIGIIVGNVLVIVAVGKFKKLRKTTNIMLASLAVADLMVGVVTVPLYIAWTMHPNVFNHSPFMCRTALLSSLLVVAASQLNLLLLSAERYLAVCAPFRHRTILISCPWLHVVVICVTWTASLVTTGLASLAIKSDYTTCNYYKAFNRWFLFFAVIFGVFIPFIAIIFMNIRVFLRVLKHEMQRKYFIGDCSDSVRQVSDSSDQEIRVPFYRQSSRNGVNYRQSTMRDYLSACIPSLRARWTEIKDHLDDDNDEVFLKTKDHNTLHEIGDNRLLSFNSHKIYIANEGRNKTIDFDTISINEGSQKDYEKTPDRDTKHSDQRLFENESILKLNTTEGSNCYDCLPGCYSVNIEQQSPSTESVNGLDRNKDSFRICDAFQENQPLLTDCTNFIIPPQQHSEPLNACHTDVVFSSADNLSLLRPNNCSTKSVTNYTSNPGQLPFHRKVYRKIEAFATPRISRKLKNADTSSQIPPSKCSTNSNTKGNTSIVDQSCEEKALEGCRKNMTFSEIEMERKEDNLRNNNHKCVDNERCYLSIPLLSQVHEVSETRSLQNLGHVLAHRKRCGYTSNADLATTTNKRPNYLDDLLDATHGRNGERKTERWLSDVLLNANDSYFVKNFMQNKISHCTTNPGPTKNEKLMTSPIANQLKSKLVTSDVLHQLAMNGQPAHFRSTFHLNDNSRKLVRGNSVPAIFLPSTELSVENVDTPEQIRFERRSSTPCVQKLPHRKVQTTFSIQKPNRSPKISQDGFWSRKLSSVREMASSQSAYVSKKVARTVALVCFSFILAWLPFFAVIIMNTFCVKCDLVYFLNVVLMITFAQSASNPIIYALCHASFRMAYKNLFRQMCLK